MMKKIPNKKSFKYRYCPKCDYVMPDWVWSFLRILSVSCRCGKNVERYNLRNTLLPKKGK